MTKPLVCALALSSLLSAQSTKAGDWPYYTGDLKGTNTPPRDQIDATNFNKLEVAWRFKTNNLGPRPEYKREGTPLVIKGVLYTTGGTRRSVVTKTLVILGDSQMTSVTHLRGAMLRACDKATGKEVGAFLCPPLKADLR